MMFYKRRKVSCFTSEGAPFSISRQATYLHSSRGRARLLEVDEVATLFEDMQSSRLKLYRLHPTERVKRQNSDDDDIAGWYTSLHYSLL